MVWHMVPPCVTNPQFTPHDTHHLSLTTLSPTHKTHPLTMCLDIRETPMATKVSKHLLSISWYSGYR